MIIRLSGVKNVRDFSELGHSGFIRSAHLNRITDRDREILVRRYDLKTVIDLRTTAEAAEKPDGEIEGVKHIHIPIFDGPVPGISHENETDQLMSQIPDMAELYRQLVTVDEYKSQLKKTMEIITDPAREGAVLWHCSEGKDRCGLVSALFLLSRGVDMKTVIDDYLLTNKTNNRKAMKYYALIMLAKRDKKTAAAVRDAFLAKREYIEPIADILTDIAKEFSVK